MEQTAVEEHIYNTRKITKRNGASPTHKTPRDAHVHQSGKATAMKSKTANGHYFEATERKWRCSFHDQPSDPVEKEFGLIKWPWKIILKIEDKIHQSQRAMYRVSSTEPNNEDHI